MTSLIEQRVRQASELANAGRWQEAEQAWRQVLAAEPRHPKALASLGVHAVHRGDLVEALQLLRAARAVAPRDLLVLMTLVAVHQRRAEAAEEREAIEAALAVDAYFIPALLARAAWYERHGTRAAAATTYRNVLRIAPGEQAWPPALRPQLEHARRLVAAFNEDKERHLLEELAPLQQTLPSHLAPRWREALSIAAERTRPFLQDCNQLHVPRLPPLTFYERELFPWIGALEQHTDAIRQELLAALQADRDRFVPYIAYNPGEPVNQWVELNHSPRWSSLHLWTGGKPVEENLARCPRTAAALAAVPRVEIEGLCPNAMFSALAPHTHIPPHHGETNARLVAHLPLVVPKGCTMRVGYDTREWEVGKVFVFDDTLEHEARNDSDELRVVLIFDVWNPLLEPAERGMVQAMARAVRAFSG
jgi:aspartyl/asparaginyl beta-hydroxylase (cupin superfamily)